MQEIDGARAYGLFIGELVRVRAVSLGPGALLVYASVDISFIREVLTSRSTESAPEYRVYRRLENRRTHMDSRVEVIIDD